MNSISIASRRRRGLQVALLLVTMVAGCFLHAAPPTNAFRLDFRYAPRNWQTAICLPDDWQKSLVGRDGTLLYDYPGKFDGFGTRISFDVANGSRWVSQELESPRVPVVKTVRRAGEVQIQQEAFAVPPSLLPKPPRGPVLRLPIQRVGSMTALRDWAHPPKPADPALSSIAVGHNQAVEYRFPSGGQHFVVVLGLCEGWHTHAGQRLLELQVEGAAPRTVDLVKEFGKNVPALFQFTAQDKNHDGWITVSVRTAAGSPDRNSILNTLWVFPANAKPDLAELKTGQNTAPALAHLDCGVADRPVFKPRDDALLVQLTNTGRHSAAVQPVLRLDTAEPVKLDPSHRFLTIGSTTTILFTEPWTGFHEANGHAVVSLPPLVLRKGASRTLDFTIARRQRGFALYPRTVAEAKRARAAARRYWRHLKLPYGHLVVPDPAVQGLLDSCIRNIFQAREIKDGMPAFQVGPTCYRGLWVVDGSFILEAMTYLGCTNATRAGIEYLMSFQRPDGGFMLINGHWKETGIALWAITRHAQLTGDRAWLQHVWPKVERGFDFIESLRRVPPKNAPNAGLIPAGFSDGGLGGREPEYTNIYWTLAGMKAAIAAARWLGHTAEAAAWQREYDDFYATFRRAAARDMRTDSHGNHYLPIRMRDNQGIPPQKAQWAFLHAVFPGKIFAPNDPLVLGNMAMLRSHECEGLVQDTGWLKNGIWTYFGSFYAHAWLWLGHGLKAAETLYAFGNHASPLLCWREEQMPVGQGTAVVGDMPHNWASAEFIRLIRHCLVLKRGNELHLLEGMPPTWAHPGAVTRVRDILTAFGPISFELKVARNGRTARLRVKPPRRDPPYRIVVHLRTWAGRDATLNLPANRNSSVRIPLSSRQ